MYLGKFEATLLAGYSSNYAREQTVPDPDLQIRGGPGLQKKFFWPFRPQFSLKIRGGQGAPPLDPPLTKTNGKVQLSGGCRVQGGGVGLIFC